MGAILTVQLEHNEKVEQGLKILIAAHEIMKLVLCLFVSLTYKSHANMAFEILTCFKSFAKRAADRILIYEETMCRLISGNVVTTLFRNVFFLSLPKTYT
jgi:hypothetical protein